MRSGVVERVTDHPHRGVLGMTSVWLGDDSTAQRTASVQPQVDVQRQVDELRLELRTLELDMKALE